MHLLHVAVKIYNPVTQVMSTPTFHKALTSAGFRTMVFPAARQAAIFHASIIRG